MRRILALLLTSSAAALPAAADWLVMRDGSRIETDGPWRVRGRAVVFTLTNGTLSSVRLDEVDLPASEKATAGPEETAEEPEPAKPPPEPVLVLTDKDIRRAAPRPAPPAEGQEGDSGEAADGAEGDEAEEGATPPVPEWRPGSVRVLSWRTVSDPNSDGIEIYGTLQNQGAGIAANLSVRVTLVDEEGNDLTSADAFLQSTALPSRGQSNFRVLFPGIFDTSGEPRFEVKSQGILIRGPAERAKEEDDLLQRPGGEQPPS